MKRKWKCVRCGIARGARNPVKDGWTTLPVGGKAEPLCPGCSAVGWEAVLLDIERDIQELKKLGRIVEKKFRLVELAPNRIKFIYAGRKDNPMGLAEISQDVQSSGIAGRICAKDGHKLGMFMTIGPQGQSSMSFCTACGLTLSEIRGAIEQSFSAAVGNEVNRRMAAVAVAAAGKSAPAGEPGSKIVELPGPSEQQEQADAAAPGAN